MAKRNRKSVPWQVVVALMQPSNPVPVVWLLKALHFETKEYGTG
jgi:hypothetical protein